MGEPGLVEVTATTALSYPHSERATAGLRAELRHKLTDASETVPDWSTLVVTGPMESTDDRGRTWFEYVATLNVRSSHSTLGEVASTRVVFDRPDEGVGVDV
jgi:hypothetical protein